MPWEGFALTFGLILKWLQNYKNKLLCRPFAQKSFETSFIAEKRCLSQIKTPQIRFQAITENGELRERRPCRYCVTMSLGALKKG